MLSDDLKQLYSEIPDDATHHKVQVQSMIVKAEELEASTEVPAWMPIVWTMLEFLSVSIILAGYIFRSQRVSGEYLRGNIGHSIEAFRMIQEKLETKKKNQNWSTRLNTSDRTEQRY